MNNVSVRVMNPEENLEKTEEILKLSVKLAKSLSENGVVVSVFDDNFGEVQVCNVCVDFSEHDKKVAEEKDKKISKLERDLKECKDEVIAVRKNRDEMMESFRNGIKPYVDLCQMHERIAELEKEIIEKNNSIIEKNQKIIELLNEIEEIKKDWCFARMSELEDRHQSDCIRINQLLTTIDVLTERYQKF